MKRYTLSVTSPEYWSEIHDALIVDSNQDGIPDRKITCSDCKHHSPTRGTYELTEEEATEIGIILMLNGLSYHQLIIPDIIRIHNQQQKDFQKM